ncbi:MAG: hypothetical protein K6F33_05180 [Bacteroidales bacterium]|nr:hypothetical protein [Bacteroidales bacterium]
MNITKAKLDKVKEQLKKEFDGIDDIIEQLFRILASWRDSANRPVVVPVFGMTGVGKTSLINRTIELLDLSDRTFKFTCGSSDAHNNETKFQNDLISRLGYSQYDNYTSLSLIKSDSVFVFDECQKMRTINMGVEMDRSEYNEIWKLLDEGGVDYKVSDSSGITSLEQWHVVLEEILRPKCGNCIVDKTKITSPGIIEDLDVLGLIDYQRDTELYKKKFGDDEDDDEEQINNTIDVGLNEEEIDEIVSIRMKELERKHLKHRQSEKYFADITTFTFEAYDENTISLVPSHLRIIIRNMLSELFSMAETMEIMKKMVAKQTFDEFCNLVAQLLRTIKSPHRIDFHNSLVFFIGNIDEAFSGISNIDPDIDADILHQLTKKVNINDVKSALESRFRKEEIARLGNNYILYPSFNRDTFNKLITRYLNTNLAAYKQTTGIDVTYTSDIIDLIYSEGVFPTQGSRSVMSTVNNFCSILSEIDHEISQCQSSAAITTANICLPNKPKNFKCDSVEIAIEIGDGKSTIATPKIQYTLLLGKLRNPAHDDSRYAKAVHELGHAFMIMLEHGKYPSMIITTSSSDSGGACYQNIEQVTSNHIPSMDTTRASVRIGLGGWVAERLVFPGDISTLGSGMDIQEVFEEIAQSYYILGVESPISRLQGSNDDGTPKGLYNSNVDKMMKEEINTLISDTIDSLKEYRAILKHTALHIAEEGSMTQQEFIDFLQNIDDSVSKEVRSQRDNLLKNMDDKAQNYPSPSKYKEILEDDEYQGFLEIDPEPPTFWEKVKSKFRRKK